MGRTLPPVAKETPVQRPGVLEQVLLAACRRAGWAVWAFREYTAVVAGITVLVVAVWLRAWLIVASTTGAMAVISVLVVRCGGHRRVGELHWRGHGRYERYRLQHQWPQLSIE